jgi:hypothetical protein
MLVFSLLAFCVQYNGKRTKCLEPSARCDYDTAIELVESGTEVILRDGFIERTIHLNAFRKFARKLLSKGAILNGWGTMINRTNAEEFFPACVTVENILSVRFFNFRTPLLHTRRVAATFLSDIEIHSCHLDRRLSLLTFAGGNISLRSTVIHETTIHDCSLLSAHLADIDIRGFVLRNSFAFHVAPVPFIALFGANGVFADSRVHETSSPQPPLFGVTEIIDVKFSNFSVHSDQH